jgi:hypothetical protein
MSELKKKKVGYVRSETGKMQGYLLRYLVNTPYKTKAKIPRPGKAGNKNGQVVCASLQKTMGKADGQKLDDGWVRLFFRLDKGVLKWQYIHTEITENTTGKMLSRVVKERPYAGEMTLAEAELVLHDRKTFGRENCFQISNKEKSIYLSCELIRNAEVWIEVLQSMMGEKGQIAALKARETGFTGRQPMCVFSGATKGPWQPKQDNMMIPAPYLTVGDRMTNKIYWENKKDRHVEVQYQYAYPDSKKYGMCRSLPRSFPMKMPPALADSPVGRTIQHSLPLALSTTGV